MAMRGINMCGHGRAWGSRPLNQLSRQLTLSCHAARRRVVLPRCYFLKEVVSRSFERMHNEMNIRVRARVRVSVCVTRSFIVQLLVARAAAQRGVCNVTIEALGGMGWPLCHTHTISLAYHWRCVKGSSSSARTNRTATHCPWFGITGHG